MSLVKVGFLLTALTALFVLIGNAVGGTGGMAIALILAVAMNVGSYWFSDKLVIKMTRARPLDRGAAPELEAMVERLAARAEIPVPALFVVDDPSPNAFATGRNPSVGVVAVNTGLLQMLNKQEVEGVIAHEMAHIKHRDTLTMAIVASVAGAIMMLATMARFMSFFAGGHDEDRPNPLVLILISIFAPLAAMIVQAMVSRAREFEADRLGAEIAGRPHGLASALQKLQLGAEAIPSHTFGPQTSHLAIINPIFGGLGKLFSTHPPTEERIKRLMALA